MNKELWKEYTIYYYDKGKRKCQYLIPENILKDKVNMLKREGCIVYMIRNSDGSIVK